MSSTRIVLFFLWLAVSSLLVSGCAVGPTMMRASHLTYNDAVQLTELQELLLNIVRLRYNDGPEFLATSSISTQYSIDISAFAGADLGDDQELRTQLLNIVGAIGYSERPTLTFTPRSDKEFTRQLISPVELEIVYLLINYGWGIDRVLRITTQSINGLRNDTLREDPIQNYDLYLRDFAEMAKQLRKLQVLGQLEFAFDEKEINASGPISPDKVRVEDIRNADKDGYRLVYQSREKTYQLKRSDRYPVLKFAKDVLQKPGFKEVADSLKLKSDDGTYRLVSVSGSQIESSETRKEQKALLVRTRSVLGAMAYLSQGVDVPPKHLEEGLVSYYRQNKLCRDILSDLLEVKTRKDKPQDAFLAVPYRGYWFYIDLKDISSRRTIGLLNSLIRLKISAAGVQNIPLLTLPVGK